MQNVGTAFGDDVDCGTGAASEFSFRIAGDRQFGQCVDRENRRRTSPDTGLIDGRQIAVSVIHICAIQQVVVGSTTITVEAEKSIGSGRLCGTDRITAGSGDQFEELGIVVSVDRKLRGQFCLNGSTGSIAGGLDHGDIGTDLDAFFQSSGA